MTKSITVIRDRIERRAERAGLKLPGEIVLRLSEYVELLRKWNARINLTGLDDKDRGLDRLIIEPLVAAKHLPEQGAAIDIGSGGGSPAIPLKLVSPGLFVRMVESKIRKAAFLREACRHLEISNVEVETGRYEGLLSRPELHEAHDILTVRAVRMSPSSLRNLQAFGKPQGLLGLVRRSSAKDEAVSGVEPPLMLRSRHALVGALSSELVVLEKQSF